MSMEFYPQRQQYLQADLLNLLFHFILIKTISLNTFQDFTNFGFLIHSFFLHIYMFEKCNKKNDC